MRKIFYLLVFVLVSCYEDDSQRVESADTSHKTSELTTFIKSITLHNAAYDDVIDGSSCFSLVFPYQLLVNNNIRTISSIQELDNLHSDDQIEIIYPVSAVFFNYNRHQMTSESDFDVVRNTCEADFDISSNPCLDFQFPISVKMFNQVGSDFHTIELSSNEDIYTHFDNLHDTDVYELDYPILLTDSHSSVTLSINSNLEFENLFHSTLEGCE